MLLTALLTACTPGTLGTSTGSEPLRTSYFHVERDIDGDRLTLLLFNSYVPCQLQPPSGDAAAIDKAQEALDIALLREGSRVVFATIQRLPGETTWAGNAPVYDEDELERHLDGLHPRAARAIYAGVNEAELNHDDGLEQTYTPTDVDLAYITPPSWFDLTERKDGIQGKFSLENVDISGHFRAEPCAFVDQHVARARAVLLTAALEATDSEE